MDWVSNERPKGDQDIKYAIIAENAKIVGNAAFGHTIINKSKHKKTILCDENKFNMYKNLPRYYDGNKFTNGDLKLYEATLTKNDRNKIFY